MQGGMRTKDDDYRTRHENSGEWTVAFVEILDLSFY